VSNDSTAKKNTSKKQFNLRRWEQSIWAFYKLKDDQRYEALAARHEMQKFQAEKGLDEAGKRELFQRHHRKRETELMQQHRQIKVQETHEHHLAAVERGLAERHEQECSKRMQVRQARAERKMRATARRDVAVARQDFLNGCSAMDRRCRSVDTASSKAHRAAQACEQSKNTREAWTANSNRFNAQRTLCSAQQQVRSKEERDQLRHSLRSRRNADAQQEEKTRMSIRALKSIGEYVNLAKQEIAVQAGDLDVPAKQDEGDMARYGKMLAAFREMSDIVRQHGTQLSTHLEEEPSKGVNFVDDSGQETSREGVKQPSSPGVSVSVEQRTLQALSRVAEELFIDAPEEERPGNHSDSEKKTVVVASEAEELQLQQQRRQHAWNTTSFLDTRSLVSLAQHMSAARDEAGSRAMGHYR